MRKNIRLSFPKEIRPLLGLTFAFTWSYAPYLANEQFQLFYRLGFAGALLVVAFIFSRHTEWKIIRPVSYTSSVLMCLAPLPSFLTLFNMSPFAFICGLFSGFGAAICFAQWFSIYCRFDTKIAINCTLIAFALSAAIRLLLVPITNYAPFATLLALFATPFISQLFLIMCDRMNPEKYAAKKSYTSTLSTQEKPQLISETAFIIEIIFYGLVFGFTRGIFFDWSNSVTGLYTGYLIRIILPLFLLLWIHVNGQESRLYTAARWLFIIALIVLCAIVLFLNEELPMVSSLNLATRNLTSILINVMLFRVVRDVDTSALVVYGIGRGFYELFLAIGQAFFSFSPVFIFVSSLQANLLLFCLSCILILLINRFSRIFNTVANNMPNETIVVGVQTVEERCKSIAESHNLSERETEMMQMICRGRSKRYIAETLFLSEETVRWHTKQLYRKLDIHNKQDLITFVGIE